MMCVRPNCAPGDGVWSTPAIDVSGQAFVGVGNPDDGVLAFDPSTGKRMWLASLYPDADRDLDIGASPVIIDWHGREVIAQAAVPVRDDDDVRALHERVKVAERALLVDTVGAMARGGWSVQGRKVKVGR